MTNYEKWKLYVKNLPSPDSYVDLSFYWLICSCLQRRVWYASGDLELYPNMYVVLVGPPAVGKGLVLGLANQLLRHHKWEEGQSINTNAGSEKPNLFPVGADSTTFEDLVDDMCKAIRRLRVSGLPNGSYAHTSYAFVLEELDSLFKKKTEDVARFLKNAYDCKDFEYTTKHQGEFRLRKPCLSFFAATQESFLRDAYKNKLFGEGFMSRTLFVFEKVPRSFAFHISDFNDEQKQAREDILAWIKNLSTIFGEAFYNAETREWLEAWYVATIKPRLLYNTNERLAEYYGRKKVTMMKLALGIHFAENTTFEIPLETFQRAIKLLDTLEPAMARAINFAGRNETHGYMLQILDYITEKKTVSVAQILKRFLPDVDLDEIQNILRELELAYGVRRWKEKEDTLYGIPT